MTDPFPLWALGIPWRLEDGCMNERVRDGIELEQLRERRVRRENSRALSDNIQQLHFMRTFLTKQELAELLKVHKRTINNWMRNTIIVYYRVGNVVRFDLDEVQEALKLHRSATH